MSLRINPEYEKMLPTMTPQEFTELKTSIQQDGQHYPIVANEDLEVLDGHHRFKACTELGLEPDFEVRKFENKLMEKKFVIEANLRRRHLNNFQLIELAVPLLEIEKALAKIRQSKGGKTGRDMQLGIVSEDTNPHPKSKAAEAVAKRVGLSTRTFERGKTILEKAPEEEKQRLREGKTSIAKVYQEVVASEKSLAPKDQPKNAPAKDLEETQRTKALITLLKVMIEKNQISCPSCGNTMLECSKCHKPLVNDNPKNNES
jgi:ParB-like chromosome segregation protein Spo0J